MPLACHQHLEQDLHPNGSQAAGGLRAPVRERGYTQLIKLPIGDKLNADLQFISGREQVQFWTDGESLISEKDTFYFSLPF